MAKGKIDYATFFYKVFIVFLILAQGYSLLFAVVNGFTLIVNFVIMVYLVFRFYLLVNLSKEAKKVFMTLPEYLARRKIDFELCEKCKDCEVKCSKC